MGVCCGELPSLPGGWSWTGKMARRALSAQPAPRSTSTMFELEWRGRRVALKASNGRYVCMKKNGQLAAVSDFVGEHSLPPQRALPCPRSQPARKRSPGQLGPAHAAGSGTGRRPGAPSPLEPSRRRRAGGGGRAAQPLFPPGGDEEFTLQLINRPMLVLRGPDGFVCRRRGSAQLDTNRSVYDVFHLSFSDGAYHIRGRGGGFWSSGAHGSVRSDGERGEDFLLELRERGRLAIRARSGKYLRGGASGLLRADADAPAGAALWEY
ncbi:Fascin-2 [Galemys pyrenaicus]|uniref:Fascin-2 n=1 Tax=Galemys pyrenaicus TaxID=202257 RepID=A0A8J5ZWN8_GALPY|nr:Fascin-2 [Galemys pyrenaicus]